MDWAQALVALIATLTGGVIAMATSEKLSSLKLTKTGQVPAPGTVHIIAARNEDDSLAYFLSFNRY